MLAFIRLAIFGLIVLTVLFWLVRLYARSVRREALEEDWNEAAAEGRAETTRDTFGEAGMRDYEKSLLRKLIWLVYVLPIVVMGLIIYLMNYR